MSQDELTKLAERISRIERYIVLSAQIDANPMYDPGDEVELRRIVKEMGEPAFVGVAQTAKDTK